MRDWYDNWPEDILAEQSVKLARGIPALVGVPTVRTECALCDEVLEAVRPFEAGCLGSIELLQRLDALRRKKDKVLVP